MQHSVFECGICFSPYNDVENKPLSLPCGHVFCEKCLEKCQVKNNTQCPADKIIHHCSQANLPVCYAILSNLPRERPKVICCLRHPRKRVKFQCKTHEKFLCSDCVIDHTGPGHQVATFSANFEVVRTQIKNVKEAIEKALKVSKQSKEAFDQIEQKMSNHCDVQIDKINTYIEALKKSLDLKKIEMIDQIKMLYQEQKRKLEPEKLQLLRKMDIIYKQHDDIKAIDQCFDKKPYEEIFSKIAKKEKEISQIQDISKEISSKFNPQIKDYFAYQYEFWELKFPQIGCVEKITLDSQPNQQITILKQPKCNLCNNSSCQGCSELSNKNTFNIKCKQALDPFGSLKQQKQIQQNDFVSPERNQNEQWSCKLCNQLNKNTIKCKNCKQSKFQQTQIANQRQKMSLSQGHQNQRSQISGNDISINTTTSCNNSCLVEQNIIQLGTVSPKNQHPKVQIQSCRQENQENTKQKVSTPRGGRSVGKSRQLYYESKKREKSRASRKKHAQKK